MVSPQVGLRVLLTDAHEQAGLGAARSLGRAGHHVTALYPDGHGVPATAASRYVARTRRGPDPWLQHHAYRDWLLREALNGGYQAVLPVSEASIAALAALREVLPPSLIVLMPGDAALRLSLSKYHATRAAMRLGVPVPRTAFLDDGSHSGGEDLSGLRYPLIIKTDNFLTKEGLYRKGRCVLCHSPVEAEAVVQEAREAGGAFIAQEYIPGSGAGAFLLRAGGRTVLRFAHRRLHEVPYSGGYSSLRASCHDPALLSLGERLLEGVGFEGVAMVEFRRGHDGVPYFLEINGRLWGSLALALHARVDFPLALLHAAVPAGSPASGSCPLAGTTGPVPYPAGLRCRNVMPGEILHLFSMLMAPRSAVGGVQKLRAAGTFVGLFLDPRIRYDYLWWSDPLPAVVQSTRASIEIAVKLAARLFDVVNRGRDARLLARLRRTGPTLPGWLSGGPGAQGRRILFLCAGNICRSPFAARYWNRRLRELGLSGPTAASAGFHERPDRPSPTRIRAMCRAFGVDLDASRSRQVHQALVAEADVVLVMDAANYREFSRRFPGAVHKVHVLGEDRGIPDPFALAPSLAWQSYERLVAALEALLLPLAAAASQEPTGPGS